MPHPYPLATAFTGGMRRDVDRTELPGGSAYNMVDFIPDEVQAVTAGRGGWTYAGASLSTASQIQVIGYHPDTGKLVAVDEDRALWDVAGATTIGTFSADLTSVPIAPPAYHRGYLIFANGSTSAHPAYYKSDGSVGTLAGSPSFGTLVGVYKDHTLLAGGTATGIGSAVWNRIWFSAAGDPTTWDTTYGWWDASDRITAIATLQNAILLFQPGSTERLRGTTPPPGSDMVLEPFLPDVGCLDPASVAYWKNNAIFVSSRGVYMTNGVSSVDLTASTQMKSYWQALMAGYSSSWRIAGGIYRDHYIVSVNNGNTLVDCLCVNLNNPAIWRFTNIHGSSFYNLNRGSQEKLYMGQWNAGRVAELSSLWSPSGTVKQDGDGTNPTPIVETGMFRGWDHLHRRWIESMGKQKWRWVYLDYDLRDAASDNPSTAVSYCTDPVGSYTTAGASILETTVPTRVRRALNSTQGGATHSQMLGLKVAVTGPYASAKLYAIEGDFSPIDIGAL